MRDPGAARFLARLPTSLAKVHLSKYVYTRVIGHITFTVRPQSLDDGQPKQPGPSVSGWDVVDNEYELVDCKESPYHDGIRLFEYEQQVLYLAGT